MLNLLYNAIKFTESGTITVSCQRSGGQLELRVADA